MTTVHLRCGECGSEGTFPVIKLLAVADTADETLQRKAIYADWVRVHAPCLESSVAQNKSEALGDCPACQEDLVMEDGEVFCGVCSWQDGDHANSTVSGLHTGLPRANGCTCKFLYSNSDPNCPACPHPRNPAKTLTAGEEFPDCRVCGEGCTMEGGEVFCPACSWRQVIQYVCSCEDPKSRSNPNCRVCHPGDSNGIRLVSRYG